MIRWIFHYIKHHENDKEYAHVDVEESASNDIHIAIRECLRTGDSLCELDVFTLPYVNLNEIKAITRHHVVEEAQTENAEEPMAEAS